MLTRKDFEALAQIIKEIPAQGADAEWLAHRVASYGAASNPRFDKARFIAACEPIPSVTDMQTSIGRAMLDHPTALGVARKLFAG